MKELVEAAGEGDVATIELLVQEGVEIDGQRVADGRCALHEAAARGHANVVALLLRLSAPLETKDDNYLTPLLHAAAAGHLPILKQLIEAGADLHATAEGKSALQLARTFNHDAVAAFLDPLFRHQNGQKRSGSASSSTTFTATAHHSTSHSHTPPSTTSIVSHAASAAPRKDVPPTERGEVLILIEMAGAVIGVADVSKGASLASLRRQMREDGLSPSASYRYLYRDTGAPVTERQESRFLVDDCIIPESPLPRLKLITVAAPAT